MTRTRTRSVAMAGQPAQPFAAAVPAALSPTDSAVSAS